MNAEKPGMATHRASGRLIAVVMTVLMALLPIGLGCAGFAGGAAAFAGPKPAMDAPCPEGRDAGEVRPCHSEDDICPRCAGAVLQAADIGDLAASPSVSPQAPAVTALPPAYLPRPALQTGFPPVSGGDPPGDLTPVALKTTLLN